LEDGQGAAIPVFRRPSGHAEAGPVIRRGAGPKLWANWSHAVMGTVPIISITGRKGRRW